MLIQLGAKTTQAGSGPVDLLLECHQRIRSFVALARSAGERPDAPVAELLDACERVERYFTKALPLHVTDEERSVLPRLRGASPEVDRALETMEAQHHQHDTKIHALLAASTAVREHPGDEARHRALREAADDLGREFEVHLAAEEQVLFPAVRALPAGEQSQIVAELRQRRQP